MAVTLNLTPTTLVAADYSTSRRPALGGEIEVELSVSPSKLLGIGLLTADGVVDYTYEALPTVGTPGPIVAVAMGNGIQQSSASAVTYAGLSGTFTPVAHSSNATFNFPVGRAVELVTAGSYEAPTSSSVPTAPGLLMGSKFALIELPLLATFIPVGSTTDRNVTLPVRGTKNIAAGMEEARWSTPGMAKAGELSITGLNQGYDDGLLRFAGVLCQAMLYRLSSERLITERTFCLDWVGSCRTPYPSGESEATVELTGSFYRAVVLPAA